MRNFQLVISCTCMGEGAEYLPFTVTAQGDVNATARSIFNDLPPSWKHKSCGGTLKVEIYVLIGELKVG